MSAIVRKGADALDALRREVALGVSDYQEALVLTLDISYSMASLESSRTMTRLEAARQASRQLLRSCTSATHAALVSFSTEERVVCPMTANLTAVALSLGSLHAYASTRLAPALKRGLAIVLAEAPQTLRRLIVLSDGLAHDSEDCLTAADLLHEACVVVDTIWFGEESKDADLLRQISAKTGGTFCSATSAADLVQRFAQLEGHVRGLLTSGQP